MYNYYMMQSICKLCAASRCFTKTLNDNTFKILSCSNAKSVCDMTYLSAKANPSNLKKNYKFYSDFRYFHETTNHNAFKLLV